MVLKILLIVLPFHILLDRLAWRSRASLFIYPQDLTLPQFYPIYTMVTLTDKEVSAGNAIDKKNWGSKRKIAGV